MRSQEDIKKIQELEARIEEQSKVIERVNKNKDKINAQRRTRRKNASPKRLEEIRELNRIRNRKYYLQNREKINERAKSRNWNYTPENGKARRERYKENHPSREILRACKKRAKKLDIPFELDETWYEEQYIKGCAVTKFSFKKCDNKNNHNKYANDGPFSAAIDRIVPSLGYTKENSRLVVACYNMAKMDWTDDIVMKMARAITKAKGGKIISENKCNKVPSLRYIKYRSKKKNLPFELDKDWYQEQFSRGCAVTGLPLEEYGTKSPYTAHIDRIKPELGYTKENSRLVISSYNMAKMNWADKDVFKMAEALIEHKT